MVGEYGVVYGVVSECCECSRSWPDLACGQIFKLTFEGKKYILRTGLTKRTRWRHFYFHNSHIKKDIKEKNIFVKNDIFHLMTPGAITIDLSSNLIAKCYRGMRRAPKCFFQFFLAIVLSEIIAIVCEKVAIFSKVDLWWPLMTSILTWPENDLSKSLRYRDGLSYVVYRLSLSSVLSS